MVMATNSIAAIDPAMLRPGRFDLIIPVGAPDRAGRGELAAEFLPVCEPDTVANSTEGFTPPTSLSPRKGLPSWPSTAP